MSSFVYEFEWDPAKADVNARKHGVSFEQAATVFRDPLALSIPDEEHSESEYRWVTLGRDAAGQYVLIVHTYEQVSRQLGRIRIVSARRPTKPEIRSYEEDQ